MESYLHVLQCELYSLHQERAASLDKDLVILQNAGFLQGDIIRGGYFPTSELIIAEWDLKYANMR